MSLKRELLCQKKVWGISLCLLLAPQDAACRQQDSPCLFSTSTHSSTFGRACWFVCCAAGCGRGPTRVQPVKSEAQHRDSTECRAQQLSKGRDKSFLDFFYCCLALAIGKTTFLFGNYKSQSALWEDSGLYQPVPSTNSQIWIRNQF